MDNTINYRTQQKMHFKDGEINSLMQSAFGVTLDESKLQRSNVSKEEHYVIWQYLRFNGMAIKDIAEAFDRHESTIKYGLEQFENLEARKDRKLLASYRQFVDACC